MINLDLQERKINEIESEIEKVTRKKDRKRDRILKTTNQGITLKTKAL